MNTKPSLPLKVQLSYALGQLGASILINVISLMLVYFYLPPKDANLPFLITQVTFLGVLNIITLIAASGRLVDAVTDPFIANWSDRSTNPRGRRLPFMFKAAFPTALFFVLMFVPPIRETSALNIVWLFVTQALFYISFTFYLTPFFALIPELGRTAEGRLNLSTWISITFVLGIMVAAQTPLLADGLQFMSSSLDRLAAVQGAVTILALVGLILMLIPTLTIDEKLYCETPSYSPPLWTSLSHILRNSYFRFYVVGDFSFFMGLAIINTALLYYVTVLLGQEEALVGSLLTVMVLLSLAFYPLVRWLARWLGKKILLIGALLMVSLIFLGACFLGKYPIPNNVQAYMLVALYSVPLSFLGVLLPTILADIVEHDKCHTGQSKEAMFFAARTFLQKFGQTCGILVFAVLTNFGKDRGDDFGIRLSGFVGFVLCMCGGIAVSRYNEKKLLQEIEQFRAQ
ncbi:MAG: MFS transporter [Gemmataceae bacterium]